MYLAEVLARSPVISRHLKCCPRSGSQDDILLVRKDSVALLYHQDTSTWTKAVEQHLRYPIRDVKIIRRPYENDLVAVLDKFGGTYILAVQADQFLLVREIREPECVSGDHAYLGQQQVIDPRGRAMASMSSEECLVIYTLADNGIDGLDFVARKKVALPGQILQSCFVFTGDDLLSLVVHVALGDRCTLYLFHWRVGDILEHLTPRGMPVPKDQTFCLYMIPLMRRPGYFLHIAMEVVSLISAQHVQCGDLYFEQCKTDLNGALPSAIIELVVGEEDNLALLAADDGEIYIISLDAYENLILSNIGPISFPATSLSLLDTKERALNTWTIFASSDSGESGVFILRVGEDNTAEIVFTESAPLTDLCIIGGSESETRLMTLTGCERSGSLVRQSLSLPLSTVREVRVMDTTSAPESMFVVTDMFGTSSILLSMPWSSCLLQYTDSEEQMLDVSDEFGVETSEPTLFFFTLNDFFVQVTSKAIYSCIDMQNESKVILRFDTTETVISAQMFSNSLAFISRRGDQYHLSILTSIKTESGDVQFDQLLPTMEFLEEPIVFHYSSSPGSVVGLLVLCFTSGRLLVMRHQWEELTTMLDCPRTTEDVGTGMTDQISSLPRDCIALGDRTTLHIFTSHWTGDLTHHKIMDGIVTVMTTKNMNGPITFIPGSGSASQVYFTGTSTGKLQILGDDEVQMHRIVFPNERPENTVFCPDPFFDPQTDTIRASGLLYHDSGWLIFATVGEQPEHSRESTEISETPRRLLYLERLNCYVVATSKTIRPDPTDKTGYTSMANIRIVQNERCISDTPIRDSRKQAMLFRPGDVIYALVQWQVMIGGKERSWTVIGASRRNPKTNTLEGRLVVLRLKQTGNKIDVRKEFSPSYAAPIYALCPMDETCLVLAYGKTIEVTMLDIESRALVTRATFTIRSPAIALHVSGGHIFAATQKDSVVVLHYKDQTLLLVASDPVPRMLLSMTMTEDGKTLIVSDKRKNVHLYTWTPEANERKLRLTCTLDLPSVIVGTKIMSIPTDLLDDAVSELLPGKNVIVAAGLDGSLHVILEVHDTLGHILTEARNRVDHGLWSTETLASLASQISLEDVERCMHSANVMTDLDTSLARTAIQTAVERCTTRLLA